MSVSPAATRRGQHLYRTLFLLAIAASVVASLTLLDTTVTGPVQSVGTAFPSETSTDGTPIMAGHITHTPHWQIGLPCLIAAVALMSFAHLVRRRLDTRHRPLH